MVKLDKRTDGVVMLNRKIILQEKEDKQQAVQLAKAVGISPLLAEILISRGYTDVATVKTFLYGALQPFHDPFLLKDMEPAVERIILALNRDEKITIYGDYDVDGITASSLLYSFLRDAKARVDVYIPKRENEGYGLNIDAISMLYARGTRLIISVDCGISGVDEVAAMPADMDIIISDHHRPPEVLPQALAIINPHQVDCAYPFKDLAGVGVAFKLCQGLHATLQPGAPLWQKYLEFVTLGTVADIVPLQGENRALVKLGLAAMQATKNIGLLELMKISGCAEKQITAETIAFNLAPRMNAAGRLEHAMSAVQLLVTENREEAQAIALKLNNENLARQEISSTIFKEAEALLQQQASIDTAIVLAQAGWHQGVIGIVASRLVDKYHLPTILLSIDGEKAKGSCRSIVALNLYEALDSCRELLVQFGGHSQAAGLTCTTDNIAGFTAKFRQEVAKRLTAEDYLPVLKPEVIVPVEQVVTVELLQELKLLEPFGAANAAPVFAFAQAKVRNASLMGAEKKHLRLAIDFGTTSYKGIIWNQAQWFYGLYNYSVVTVAFAPKINIWKDTTSVDLQILAINPRRCIFDYRIAQIDKQSLLKNILQTGEKTVIYVDSDNVSLALPRAKNATVLPYGQQPEQATYTQVVFYDLPRVNIFEQENFPLAAGADVSLYLLYRNDDFNLAQQRLEQEYPDRKHLVAVYKFLSELLKRQGVAQVEALLGVHSALENKISSNDLKIFSELNFIKLEQGQISMHSNKKNELEHAKTFCVLRAEYQQIINNLQVNLQLAACKIAKLW